MGVEPKSFGQNMQNKKLTSEMDNELENRLHAIESSMESNLNKCGTNSNDSHNKTIPILYQNIWKIIWKQFHRNQQHQQHRYHRHRYNYYDFNNNSYRTILQILLTTFVILMLRTTTINCLPVTSKPIENTPENLAWEAWIMLPPPATSERHRKIMPKSIFVLPTNINNNSKDNLLPVPQPQIQCPPGHRVDNSKCIPTISINRDQLLIDQLTNLLPVSMKPDDSNYDDYDYDYSNGDQINYDLDVMQSYQHQQLPPLINSQNSFRDGADTPSEPLKINFALDKFVLPKDDVQHKKDKITKDPTKQNTKKETDHFLMDYSNENSNEDLKVRPFRDQETSSSSINISTATIDPANEQQSNAPSTTEVVTDEKETQSPNEKNSKQTTTEQQHTTGFELHESSTLAATGYGNAKPTSESNDSNTDSVTTQFNRESQTESKRESSPITTTTTTNFDASATTDSKTNSTEQPTDQLESANTEKNSNVFDAAVETSDATTMVSLLSSDEDEMAINSSDNINSTTSEYEYDQMTTLQDDEETDTKKNPSFEKVTEQVVKSEKTFEQKLWDDVLMFDDRSSESSSEISVLEDFTTNTPFYDEASTDLSEDASTDLNAISKPTTESTTPIRGVKTTTDRQLSEKTKNDRNSETIEHEIIHVKQHKENKRHHKYPQAAVSISASQPIEWHEDREPLMESIESNNRFVYHHLGSSSTLPESPPSASTGPLFVSTDKHITKETTSTTTTQRPIKNVGRDPQADINEQLRIINMIVEENKRRAQASKVRFPEGSSTSTSSATPPSPPLRTIVRFPATSQQVSTPHQVASSYYQPQSGRFDPEKLIFHRRFFQQQYSTTQAPPSTTSATTTDTNKPFWWLPTGWEIDQSGDRPMLIRFWSRSPSRNSEQFSGSTDSFTDQYRTASPNTQHIEQQANARKHPIANSNSNLKYEINTSGGSNSQHTTTTSRYRENSRSPTDSLFSEVPSSQNVYKVLNTARQWKYNER